MRVEVKRFELQKVAKFIIDINELFDEQIQKIKEQLLKNGAYTTSPIIYKYNSNVKTIELFFQITQQVDMNEDMPFDMLDRILYEKCLFVRYIKENEAYEEMSNMVRKHARENNILVEEPFLVLIPIPGGSVLDMYWPIKEQENDI